MGPKSLESSVRSQRKESGTRDQELAVRSLESGAARTIKSGVKRKEPRA